MGRNQLADSFEIHAAVATKSLLESRFGAATGTVHRGLRNQELVNHTLCGRESFSAGKLAPKTRDHPLVNFARHAQVRTTGEVGLIVEDVART